MPGPFFSIWAAPDSPREWQGALPFTYHVGPGPVRVKMHLKQDYQFRTLWDVIGRVRGSEMPDEWVVAGNHRDAWVYGAVDPNSGTAAMLESVHGVGELLKSGWKPKRTIVFCQLGWRRRRPDGFHRMGGAARIRTGQCARIFQHGCGGFRAEVWRVRRAQSEAVSARHGQSRAQPQGRDGLRSVAESRSARRAFDAVADGSHWRCPPHSRCALPKSDVPVGDLGSGSDYSAFQQHLGVPSTDVTSSGPYGVYHSVFDNFAWFKKFGDPDFVYEQQMARVFGLEALRMADADVLPYDYEEYGKEVSAYLEAAGKRAESKFGEHALDFSAVTAAAKHFQEAGAKILSKQKNPPRDPARLNQSLRGAERALLVPEGLPHRPWFRHAIYAPGEYTGYAAVVIPGVNEAIDKGDADRARQQLAVLAAALERAAKALEGYR